MIASRRLFLRNTGTLAGAIWVAPFLAGATRAAPSRGYRAAIVGHTGAGDYGHGYERVFDGLANVTVVALADPDAAGRQQAAARAGAQRTYADYRVMFEQEQPDLVSVAMRLPHEHLPVARAAFAVGASVFIEKPITETLPEADALVAEAERCGVKVSVAHTRRLHRDFLRVKRLLEEGFAGEVRQVRMQGKQDARVGGEDMIVLGTHDFDLLRFYFGDPSWCQAVVTVQGRPATFADVRRGREPVRVAGDTIHAQFGFPNGLVAAWSSVRTGDDWNTRRLEHERWNFEILGTKRCVAWQSGLEFGYLDSPFLLHFDQAAVWRRLPEPQTTTPETTPVHPIVDLIDAIESDRPPRCSGADGRWAIEMLAGVYQSHFTGRRVGFPLEDRRDPLAASA